MLKYIPSVGKIIKNTISNQKQAIWNDFKSKSKVLQLDLNQNRFPHDFKSKNK